MKTAVSLFFLAIAVLFIGCKSDSTTETPTDTTVTIKDFLPAGLKWTYTDSDRAVIGGPYTTVMWRVKLDDYNNHPTFGTVRSDKTSDTSAFYLSGDTALYSVYRPLGSIDPSYIYPMAEGEERVYDKNHAATGSADFKAIRLASQSVSITVPAGTFNCLQYDKIFYNVNPGTVIDTVELSSTFLCPKKGVIKSYSYDFQNGIRQLRFERTLKTIEPM